MAGVREIIFLEIGRTRLDILGINQFCFTEQII